MTPMQDLREDIISSVLLSESTKTIVAAFIDNHLEKEKQQIIDARENGLYTESNGTDSDRNKSSEDYYNETFKK